MIVCPRCGVKTSGYCPRCGVYLYSGTLPADSSLARDYTRFCDPVGYIYQAGFQRIEYISSHCRFCSQRFAKGLNFCPNCGRSNI